MASTVQWSDVQVFLAVCARGSLGAAAAQLGVNHSTVLRRLGRLEESLRVRLFDRLPGGYTLTEQGLRYAAALAGLDDQLGSAERAVSGDDGALEGRVRLTIADALLPLVLPALAAFRRQHPAVQIELLQGNAFLSLAQREADIAVRGANRVPDTLVGQPVGTIRTALYGVAERFAAGEGIDPDWPWIGHTEALAQLASARWVADNVAAERVVMRVDSLPLLADAVAAGIGVGWVLQPLAVGRPGLAQLQPPPAAFDTRIWVLWHPELRRVARVRVLAEHLAQWLRADPRLAHPP
jgi:DNA-binding transcriptional LysR family regulator